MDFALISMDYPRTNTKSAVYQLLHTLNFFNNVSYGSTFNMQKNLYIYIWLGKCVVTCWKKRILPNCAHSCAFQRGWQIQIFFEKRTISLVRVWVLWSSHCMLGHCLTVQEQCLQPGACAGAKRVCWHTIKKISTHKYKHTQHIQPQRTKKKQKTCS